MEISIKADEAANRLSIEINGIAWEACKGEDFYQGELRVQELVAGIGQELTKELMVAKEEKAWRIEVGGTVYYRKQPASVGHYKSLYGNIAVERHLYQTAQGGETICPLERHCQMEKFGSATPLLAEVIAFKVSAMTPREVALDLEKGHRVAAAPSYIAETAQAVGQIAVDKKEAWELQKTGTEGAAVRVVATGMDGATLPLVDENYKMAMVGTIALYDAAGERQSTEYLGAMPEAGREGFYRHWDGRVADVLEQYPEAVHVALCDGERGNWEHIDTAYPKALDILDFFHGAEHLAKAADSLFGRALGEEKQAWYEYYYATLQEAKDGVYTLIRELIYQGNHKQDLSRSRREALDTEITYFQNNAPRMHYWEYLAWGLPIGSGVTEAGCKELIKSRFCRSGMKWKRASGDTILQLRAIRLSKQWDTFWFKVIRYVA
jgi:hypothetical protein